MAESREGRSPTCPTCARTFADYRGRRVHERVQHPSSFHASEAEPLRTERRRARWDPEELAMMAEYEANSERAKNINQMINQHVLPHRTIEAIKGAFWRELRSRTRAARARPGSERLLVGPTSRPRYLYTSPGFSALKLLSSAWKMEGSTNHLFFFPSPVIVKVAHF
ncbi:Retrovirus-related Pol polyprotein from type-2 retrotransposable element R2DM [Portunus trituberculatus]|uniref:Retrovirus-related Pol polyprotein from type-2 retrotransposable element R2DM n=1 Tax=Portunus trituberculatus TaxID=210409 RepID=A0A5B7EGM8_PORTR|nr:Retrovirus-related Pol polyprotein from type-2 retrotransposable element R2DM [Portunus trituberculatus]